MTFTFLRWDSDREPLRSEQHKCCLAENFERTPFPIRTATKNPFRGRKKKKHTHTKTKTRTKSKPCFKITFGKMPLGCVANTKKWFCWGVGGEPMVDVTMFVNDSNSSRSKQILVSSSICSHCLVKFQCYETHRKWILREGVIVENKITSTM